MFLFCSDTLCSRNAQEATAQEAKMHFMTEPKTDRIAFVRDFVAITGFFVTLYAWFVVGAALTA